MENGEAPKTPTAAETLTLSDGRRITVTPPSGGNAYVAAEVAGQNPTLVPMCEMLLCVAAIDGQPEPKARTRQMMIALADRIGRSGLDVLNDWYQSKVFPEAIEAINELGAEARPEAVAARISELRKNRLKNSLQTQ